jgi:hypothetical protein
VRGGRPIDERRHLERLKRSLGDRSCPFACRDWPNGERIFPGSLNFS